MDEDKTEKDLTDMQGCVIGKIKIDPNEIDRLKFWSKKRKIEQELSEESAKLARFNENGCPHCGYKYYDPLIGGTKSCLCRGCNKAY